MASTSSDARISTPRRGNKDHGEGNGNVDTGSRESKAEGTGATNWQTDSWWLLALRWEWPGLLASVSQTFQHCGRLIRDFPSSPCLAIVHFQISLEYYRGEGQSLTAELREENVKRKRGQTFANKGGNCTVEGNAVSASG